MLQIQITGPSHAKKGYAMVAIAKALRELGMQVELQGESTHLAEKMGVQLPELQQKLDGQFVRITELQTASYSM